MSRGLNILLTGFTSRIANTVTDRVNIYITSAPLVAEMLQRAGHTVDWRPTIFGEEGIEKYDIVMLGCSDPNSYTGMVHRYGAYWALLKARRLMIWFDDWRIKGQFHAWVQQPEALWQTRMLHNDRLPEHEQAIVYKNAINSAVMSMRDEHRPAVMAQLFNWGNDQQFMKEVPEAKWLARFDISGLVPKVLRQPPRPLAQRTKGWVAASLTQVDDWTDKLQLTWPLIKQAKPKGRAFGGWKKIREVELVNTLYADHTGILCKPYSHAGSGWWRSRFNYAVETRSVLLGDMKEVSAIGESFRLTPSLVESMNDADLQDLANRQAAEFLGWQDSPERAIERLNLSLLRIMDEPARPTF